MSKRELSTKDNIRLVTANDFAYASGLELLGTKARKLLYLIIGQCQKNDEGFYEYCVPIIEFSELLGVDPSNVYEEADKIADELAKGSIKVIGSSTSRYPLTARSEYNAASFRVELNPRLAELLLNLSEKFSRPFLNSFMQMKNAKSMAIWHIMQVKMQSRMPSVTHPIKITLTIDELRQVTNCMNKYPQSYDYVKNVLKPAINDIEKNVLVQIDINPVKKCRTVESYDVTIYNWASKKN